MKAPLILPETRDTGVEAYHAPHDDCPDGQQEDLLSSLADCRGPRQSASEESRSGGGAAAAAPSPPEPAPRLAARDQHEQDKGRSDEDGVEPDEFWLLEEMSDESLQDRVTISALIFDGGVEDLGVLPPHAVFRQFQGRRRKEHADECCNDDVCVDPSLWRDFRMLLDVTLSDFLVCVRSNLGGSAGSGGVKHHSHGGVLQSHSHGGAPPFNRSLSSANVYGLRIIPHPPN